LAAARESLRLAKLGGSQAAQAEALKAICQAAVDSDSSQAIAAAEERVKLLRQIGDRPLQAMALIDLASAYLARLRKKLSTCSIPSAEDTIGALRSAKDAHTLFVEQRSTDGQARALPIIARVLLFNGVHPDIVEASANPDEIFADVMSGKYSSSQNALPQQPQPTNLKVEDVIPDSKQLDRGKFGWNNATAGFCYTVVWQPIKDRKVGNSKPRGQYDLLTLGTGYKHHAVPTTVALRSNDASERNDALVVFMTTPDSGNNYATSIMSAQHTLGGMIEAQLRKMVFVQFGESFFDFTDTTAQRVEMHSVTLALLRSARIEAPFLTIGFVGGDAASWMHNPAPLIESIFDTVESDECEIMYKNGEGFAPSMLHRPVDEQIQAVKPGKVNGAKFAR